MFKVKIRAGSRRSKTAVNPADLVATDQLVFSIYRAISAGEKLWLCGWTIAVTSAVGLHIAEQGISWSIAAAMLAALAGLGIVSFDRRIAHCTLYFARPGDPMPIVAQYTGPKLQHHLNTNDFYFAVRQTEPSVAERLLGYIPKHSYIYALSERTTLIRKYLRSQFPAPNEARRVLATVRHRLRQDLSPLCRLAIGRTLYQRDISSNQNRAIGSEDDKPDLKARHYYFTYKLHLVPVANWLLMLALALVMPELCAFASHRKELSAAIGVMFLAWGVGTLVYNIRTQDAWRRWLERTTHRPLGCMPTFLYIPKNEAHARWEELDEQDYRSYLESFVIDTSAAFTIILGSFVGLGMTISARLI